MRILQLIDSLETGGAERMAVNYANGLVDYVPFSGLVATRKEGPLKTQLNDSVHYLFLDKKSAFDIKALLLLRAFVKKQQITIIQAHSSSYFLAILLKLTYTKIKIVWHDHYGNSEFLEKRKKVFLQFGSLFFYRIIVVNELLKKWAIKNLFCRNVVYLPNFVLLDNNNESIVLEGVSGKRILCLANLRPQKNHSMLLEIAKRMKLSDPQWTFHLIGKDFRDEYSNEIHKQIVKDELENTVFIYGSSNAVASAIQQSTIGILTSLSEGLPVSLLEYGYFGLPVVSTAVGEIPNVINKNNGFLVPPNDIDTFQEVLHGLIENVDLRNSFGEQLKKDIHLNYTKETVFKKYFAVLNNES